MCAVGAQASQMSAQSSRRARHQSQGAVHVLRVCQHLPWTPGGTSQELQTRGRDGTTVPTPKNYKPVEEPVRAEGPMDGWTTTRQVRFF